MTKTEFIESDAWRKLELALRRMISGLDKEYRSASSMHEVRYTAGYADALDMVLAMPDKLLSDGAEPRDKSPDVIELPNHPNGSRNTSI